MSEIFRMIEPHVLRALEDTPVVMIEGPRQAGKSTLVRGYGIRAFNAEYVTLDDAIDLAAATADPQAFVRRPGMLVIDEVQRAPELLLAIKAEVDRDRRPGRFLLTGSADVLTLPRVSESLAGRLELLRLWPFTQSEIAELPFSGFVGRLFERGRLEGAGASRDEIVERALRGGFPPAVARDDPERRTAWFRNYLTTMTQRDVREISNIGHAVELPRLLRAIALRSTQPLNKSGIAQTLGMSNATIDRYIALLETLFVIHRIPAWHGNVTRRLVKAPKLLISDPGLAGALTGASTAAFESGVLDAGPVVEAFVGIELVRLAAVDPVAATVHHYRASRGGAEIDFLLELPDGRVAAVEVKAGETVTAADARHIAALRDELGDRFSRGVVLYAGDRTIPFGDRIEAVPIAALWAP
ncbi:ATP-binding protein [Conexibacter sp. JD483]|uniref:ATP-binding protein n=1 Tax=unclassified Conexibacter TaxID=2627773 RepID=UPI0027225A12|nr:MULTISPECIES: ATP-binding protein [unclassified Conexibacter]MDO8185089.1 ATP-binding protein [Conexibacter sp. CPCC 205706]MDO8196799.1 ATP-binding protein [Conexibacter sp. CPCC 205762]MDR9368047.1 ATP-binding protein [Conexibacter sp. JD483]